MDNDMRTADYSAIALRDAWLRRKGPDWPETYEQAMANPVYCRLVLLETARIAVLSMAQREEFADAAAADASGLPTFEETRAAFYVRNETPSPERRLERPLIDDTDGNVSEA